VLTDLRVLVTDTGRVWWRLLPLVLSIYLLGWLGAELTLRIAVILGDISPWLTLVLFAFSFVCLLTATVLILNLAGRELGIRELLPEDERTVDDRDSSISRLLAITLLPFLGMYAAFGQVQEAANRVVVQQIVRYGVISDVPTVLGALNELAVNRLPLLVTLLVSLYVGRRLLDLVHDRTGWRLAGLAVVLIESFFILLLVMGGVRAIQIFLLWLRQRAFLQWLSTIGDAIADAFAFLAIDLPAVLERLGRFFGEQVWPIFLEVLTQPLLWLAVAALVYGSRVLSLAELWRRGQPYAARVPGASVFARYAEKRSLRRTGPPPRGVRLAADQTRQAFFGDLDDKYLPTFHSLRLVLRAGPLFLGSYILAYALVLIAQNYFETLLHWVVGGRDYIFWIRWEPAVAVLTEVPFETLRLCLLAVAFRRCLELFSQRVQGSPTATPPSAPAPVPVGAASR
jgi:hypothetical protein